MAERMTSTELADLLTKDDIISLMQDLGSDDYAIDEQGDLKFKTICHGGDSNKLYYYHESIESNKNGRTFHCYTSCGSMSIFDLLMQVHNWTFMQAFNFVSNFKGIDSSGINKPEGFKKGIEICKDWGFLNKYKKMQSIQQARLEKVDINKSILPHYNKSILKRFDKIYPSSWETDYISTEAMAKFGIRFYTIQWKVVIPHYDINGELVGIRGRSFLTSEVEKGNKYMPVYYNKEDYRHPLQFNIYGLYQNIDLIKEKKKIILFESEKAVMQCESFYPNNNFSVALCGSNMSNYQRDLILSLDVDEVIIALDKQYLTIRETDKQIKEYDDYIKKVKKIADRLVNYLNVYIVFCDDDRLDYKDSPSDKGKDILEQLMKEKIKYRKVYDN